MLTLLEKFGLGTSLYPMGFIVNLFSYQSFKLGKGSLGILRRNIFSHQETVMPQKNKALKCLYR